MINFFRKKVVEPNTQIQYEAVLVEEPLEVPKEKSTNEVIAEIHDTFFTEVDRLLISAKQAKSLDTDKQDLINKRERLKNLGFTNAKEVKEAEVEIERLDNLKKENESKKNLIEAINYFSFKYPNYKFITEDSVLQICNKYGLVYGGIEKYIGTVPDKNLKHIEDFKVLEDDECHIHSEWCHSFDIGRFMETEHYQTSKETAIKIENNLRNPKHSFFGGISSHTIDKKCPLEIVAPIKDFNTDGMDVKNFKLLKIEVPDPIVLKPVIFNNTKYYLIVTAWGIEASDELIVNANHN